MLKELEGIVLGFVFKMGPCTAYQVRQMLKHSPSSHWRGSAGSIYPLLERLERDGLIRAEDDPGDGRARRELSITADGRKALKAWVKAGAAEELVAQVSDPVRTRIFFLDALTAREQTRLANDMLAALEGFLAVTKDDYKAHAARSEKFQHLGALGAMMSNQARVAYLREVVKALGETD